MLMDNMNGDQVAPGQENQEILNNEPVVEPAAEPEAETSAMDTSEPEAKPEAEPETQPVTEPVEEPKNDDPIVIGEKPKKSKTPLIIAIIVLLLLAGGAAAAYFLLNNKPEEQKNNSQTQNENASESEFRMAGNSISDFDLALLKQKNNKTNAVYSPLSIKYSLSMLADGANGDTKTEIENVIGDYKAKAYLNSKNRSLANALFIGNDHKDTILKSYIDGLKTKYAASVIFDDFTSAYNVNKWISDQTLGIINNFYDDGDVADKDFILINALAIDMTWKNRIQCAWSDKTAKNSIGNIEYGVHFDHEKYYDNVPCLYSPDNFVKIEFGDEKENIPAATIGATVNNYDIVKTLGEDKIRSTVKAEYTKWLATSEAEDWREDHPEITKVPTADEVAEMYLKDMKATEVGFTKASTDFKMYVDTDVKVIAKDLKEYDGSTLQYVGIMPTSKSLKEYIADTNAKDISDTVNKAYDIKKENFKDGVISRVTGYIPFFKFEDKTDLIEGLGKLGIKKVFDGKQSDLSNMINAEGASITDARHKADIEFSNDGIRAAAVSAEGGAGGGGFGFNYEFDVPIEDIDITFNKPYLFLIRDKDTGEVWFAGSVYEPLKEVK